MNEFFNYKCLQNENTFAQFAYVTLWWSRFLGDYYFPEMKKRNRKRLNKTLYEYVKKQILWSIEK